MNTATPKTEQELKDYCFKPRPDETPVSGELPLGQVRCVARLDHGSSRYWTGRHWCQNSSHAKRYINPSRAKMVATMKDAIVVRFYNDKVGNHHLRYS